MAPILSFASRVFRTRDPSRDAATDRDRLMTVRSSIVAAIDSAVRERDGLKRRVDDYFASASHILDQTDFNDRSADDEAAISRAERQGSAGLHRIAVIDAHISHLNDMLAYFDEQDVADLTVAAG